MTMPNTRYARARLLVAGLLGGMVGTASNEAKPPLKLDYVTVNGVRLFAWGGLRIEVVA